MYTSQLMYLKVWKMWYINTFKSEILNMTQVPVYVNTWTWLIVVIHTVTFGSLEQIIPHREVGTGFMNSGLNFRHLNVDTFLAEVAFTSFHFSWYIINLLHPLCRFFWKWVHSPVWQLSFLKRGKGSKCILFLLVSILAFSYIHLHWQPQWGSWSWPSDWNP